MHSFDATVLWVNILVHTHTTTYITTICTTVMSVHYAQVSIRSSIFEKIFCLLINSIFKNGQSKLDILGRTLTTDLNIIYISRYIIDYCIPWFCIFVFVRKVISIKVCLVVQIYTVLSICIYSLSSTIYFNFDTTWAFIIQELLLLLKWWYTSKFYGVL